MTSSVCRCVVLATAFLIASTRVDAQTRNERGRLELEVQYRIAETIAVGTRVGQLNTDARLALQSQYSQSEYSSLTYVFSKESQFFLLDASTSVISLNAPIDRETIIRMFLENHAEAKTTHGIFCSAPNGSQSVYSQLECRFSLLVGVRSGGNVRWITINVVVLDVNDNAPSWSNVRSLNISIPEQVPINYCARITPAIDQDFQQNGTVFYSVATQRTPVPFELRQGAISDDLCVRVVSALDRELREHYVLNLIARDGGSPSQSTSVMLNVYIADDNDNAPLFNRTYETVQVSEATEIHTAVYTAVAFDCDISDRSRLRYSVSSTQDTYCGQAFRMDAESGNLIVAGTLDRETRTACHLQVSVTDGKFTGEQALTVHFEDVNDNPPRIEIIQLPDASKPAPPHADFATPTFEIVEHSVSYKMVVHVEVSDADDSQNNNNMISCSLDNGENFRLDQHKNDTSGSITYTLTSSKPFDREFRSMYELSIRCRDFGEPSLTSRRNVTVIITDINDNAPEFSQSEYSEKVKENNVDNYVALYAHAQDQDAGENARVEYILNRMNLPRDVNLEVNRDTGEVRILNKLDRERHGKSLTFQIIARDFGTPRRSSSVPVTLHIIDVNDHAPKFGASQYRFEVREDAPLYTEVGRVQAFDADAEAPNCEVSYDIQRQVPHSNVRGHSTLETEMFRINASGTIELVGHLDYERVQSYTLYLVARDLVMEQHSQSAFVSVQIEVKDVNDNRPRWHFPSEKMKSQNVSCNEPIGKVVAQLVAKDDDSEENSNLLYSISHLSSGFQHHKDEYFAVNDLTGQVSVSKTLPCPTGTSWNDVILVKMVVNVTDRGATSHSTVSVLDIFLRNVPPSDSIGSTGRSVKSESGFHFNLTDQSVIIVLCAVLATLLTAVVMVIVAACYKLRKPSHYREDDEDFERHAEQRRQRCTKTGKWVNNATRAADAQKLCGKSNSSPTKFTVTNDSQRATASRTSWNKFGTLPAAGIHAHEADLPCTLWREVDIAPVDDHISEETEGNSEGDYESEAQRNGDDIRSPKNVIDLVADQQQAAHADEAEPSFGALSPHDLSSYRTDVSFTHRSEELEATPEDTYIQSQPQSQSQSHDASARASCTRIQSSTLTAGDSVSNRRPIRPFSSTLMRKSVAPRFSSLHGSRTTSHTLFNHVPSQKFSPFSLRQSLQTKLQRKSSNGSANSNRSSHSDLASATAPTTMTRSLVEGDSKAAHTLVYEAQSFKPGQQSSNQNQTSTFV